MTLNERQEIGLWTRDGSPAVDFLHIDHKLNLTKDECFHLDPTVLLDRGQVDSSLAYYASKNIEGCHLLRRISDGFFTFTRRDDLIDSMDFEVYQHS